MLKSNYRRSAMSNKQPDPIRPLELEEGSQYLLRRKPATCDPESWERVRFVGYTPCPAVVIVMVEPGKRMPIARDELFMLSCPSLLALPAGRFPPSLS